MAKRSDKAAKAGPTAIELVAIVAATDRQAQRPERATVAMTNDDGAEAVGTVFGVLKYGWVLSSGVTLLPACLIVLAGEIAHVRSALYYIVGGGLSLVAIPLLARLDPSAGSTGAAVFSWQLFATAGFVGGLVYWLIAGRRA